MLLINQSFILFALAIMLPDPTMRGENKIPSIFYILVQLFYLLFTQIVRVVTIVCPAYDILAWEFMRKFDNFG